MGANNAFGGTRDAGRDRYFFTLPTGDLIRLFLSVIYQQSKYRIEQLPDLYGDNANQVIDALVSNIVNGTDLSTDKIEKFANIVLDDRDLSWIFEMEEDMNPAAYNVMLPSDYKSDIFYQYLTKTSPRATADVINSGKLYPILSNHPAIFGGNGNF